MPDYSFIARGLPPIDIASPLMQVESMRRARAQDKIAEERNALFAASEQRQSQQFEASQAATQEQARARQQLPAFEAAVANGTLGEYLSSIPEMAQFAGAANNPEFVAMLRPLVYQQAGMEAPKQGGGVGVGNYNPGDYTPDTWSQFHAGGYKDPSVLRRQYAPPQDRIVMVEGAPVAYRGGQVTPLSSPEAERAAKAEETAAVEAAKVTGKADAERPANQRKAQTALEASRANFTSMNSAVARIRRSPAIKDVTGLVGANIPVIPGTTRASLLAQIDTLKSKAGFAILQAMRDASPTGGALGQVSERELMFLQNNIASLERAQTPEDFLASLDEFEKWAEGSMKRLEDAYQRDFGLQGGPSQIQSDEEYDALPSGAEFIAPDGTTRRKP